MSIRLTELVKRLPPDTQQRVEEAKKRHGNAVREALRAETALRLNRPDADSRGEEESRSIPVYVKAALPLSLEKFEFPEDERLALLLWVNRRCIELLAEGSAGVQGLIGELQSFELGKAFLVGQVQDLGPAHLLASHMLQRLRGFDPFQRIFEVHEGILGAYFYTVPRTEHIDSPSPRVELYWGVIGLFAQWLNLSPEDLTVAAMAHELAHGYTHIGADIEGDRWPSIAFSKTETGLKEGLAQYYAARVCQRMAAKHPGPLRAFEEMLPRLPMQYHTHKDWLEHHQPESVRLAMLQLRRREVLGLDQFNAMLTRAADSLRRNRQQSLL